MHDDVRCIKKMTSYIIPDITNKIDVLLAVKFLLIYYITLIILVIPQVEVIQLLFTRGLFLFTKNNNNVSMKNCSTKRNVFPNTHTLNFHS